MWAEILGLRLLSLASICGGVSLKSQVHKKWLLKVHYLEVKSCLRAAMYYYNKKTEDIVPEKSDGEICCLAI